MLIFCQDKILVKDKIYDFSENFLSSRRDKNIKISTEQTEQTEQKSSKNLPEFWQSLPAWVDVDNFNFEPDEKLLTLRDFIHNFDDEAMTIISKAWQFRNWLNNIKFCSHCGDILIPNENDYGRKCRSCGMTFYAPISPAVIIAVEKNGKLLLAHNTAWPEKLYSIIAGFVEPGERLEETVRREIFEEVSIEVKNIKYFGSQTWPFPNSLMLGFTAEYQAGAIRPDGIEITHADFFSPDEIRNGQTDKTDKTDKRINLPAHESIARKMIDNFLATR